MLAKSAPEFLSNEFILKVVGVAVAAVVNVQKKIQRKHGYPVTKLGRLVNDGKIHSLEEIYLFSLPIKVRSLLSNVFIRKSLVGSRYYRSSFT